MKLNYLCSTNGQRLTIETHRMKEIQEKCVILPLNNEKFRLGRADECVIVELDLCRIQRKIKDR